MGHKIQDLLNLVCSRYVKEVSCLLVVGQVEKQNCLQKDLQKTSSFLSSHPNANRMVTQARGCYVCQNALVFSWVLLRLWALTQDQGSRAERNNLHLSLAVKSA